MVKALKEQIQEMLIRMGKDSVIFNNFDNDLDELKADAKETKERVHDTEKNLLVLSTQHKANHGKDIILEN